MEQDRLHEYAASASSMCLECDRIDPDLFDELGVKRGLRDKNGNGVLAGLTNISKITAFKTVDGV